jgi:sugar phosphate isomerase/epimerase
MEITRRRTVTALCALAATASLPHAVADAKSRKGKQMRPLGIQTFMLKRLLDKDFQGTLNQVGAIGYREIEAHSFFGRNGTDFRKALDQAGLTCPSAHVLLDPLPGTPGLTDPATAEMLLQIGAKYAVVPIFPLDKVNLSQTGGDEQKLALAIWKAGADMSLDDWKRVAHRINETGVQLAKSGITIGYHNHNLEFAKLSDGGTPLEVLLRETDPGVVKLELDIGWAAAAGVDVVAFLDQHASRINQVHLKDTTEPSGTGLKFTPARLGEGILKWDALLKAIKRANVEHLYIEQEEPFKATALEEARIAFEFMSQRPELQA